MNEEEKQDLKARMDGDVGGSALHKPLLGRGDTVQEHEMSHHLDEFRTGADVVSP